MPFCSLEPAAKDAGGSRTVIVVRGGVTASMTPFGGASEISIVGQQSATIAAAAQSSAVHVAQGGKLYSRDTSITAVLGVGIVADNGSTLRMERVTVANSAKGGISLIGAAFDISNTKVTANGQGVDGGTFWGGIYIKFPPSSGPTRLNLVSVTSNMSIGISCTGTISGSGVLAASNAGGDISPTCGFSSCATASASCGAQP
jgi:hypothetical protein